MRSSGFARNFFREPLIMLRADVDFIRCRHRHSHLPQAALISFLALASGACSLPLARAAR